MTDGTSGENSARSSPIPSGVPGVKEYYRLLERLPAGAYTCDADGLITWFNRRAVEIWGREPKLNDSKNRFCGAWRHYSSDGEPVQNDQCWVALALKEGREYDNYETVIERPDGSRITVLVHAHPLHDDAGVLVGAATLLTDISERKKAEETQGRLVAIVDSADDAIVGKDLNGIITDWNRGAERLFGYTSEEAIGRSITMLIPPDLADEEPNILGRIRRGEAIEHYETVRRHKNGTKLHISLSVSPIHDSRGQIIGAAKIARDISERIRMEDALREADRRKDEFLAMLSHELRNPLATIRNSVQLLRMHPGQAMQKKVLSPLERQVNTLSRLVDDLLDVSRVTTGRVRLQRADIQVHRLVCDAADSMRSEMAEREHAFIVSPPDRDLCVNGDVMRLEQVIVNLLTNAAKYTPDGGRVRLLAEREGDEAILRVQDSGIGISRDALPHIFSLFSQASITLDRSMGGLGIGLALVKYLVELHGGTVTAASDGPGKGSEFVVRLPALDTAAGRPRGNTPAGGLASELAGSELAPPGANGPDNEAERGSDCFEEGRAGGLRILVVDDNQDTADLQATLLRHNGYKARTAYDGRAALQVAEKFQPHVILLDIGLPNIDGYEVAYRIRQEDALADVVLVAMTGYGQEEDRQRSQAAGFDHHLVKPAEFAELQRILAKVEGARERR